MIDYKIKTVKITETIEECVDVKTIVFDVKDVIDIELIIPKPGQFLMIWVPGIDEVPMSISNCDTKGLWSITVKNVGECTKAIHELNIGDYIGIRGPIGNGFTIPEISHHVLIGGGTGIAPLKFLALKLNNLNQKFTFIGGAKKNEELFFKDEINSLTNNNSNIIYCTDDGSYGLEGFASDIFENHIKNLENNIIKVYACGPEIMMYKVYKICEKYNFDLEVSLERIMRCGCGLCGLCAIDPLGFLVCKDGPIFGIKQLRNMTDFGKFKRDLSGKKILI